MHDKNKATLGVAGSVAAVVKALASSPSVAAPRYHLLSSLAELDHFHGNCTLAVRAGAVPVLVRILGGPAEDLSGASVFVLARLARFEEGIKAIREMEGVTTLLVNGLRTGCTVSTESAMEVLVRLLEENVQLMRDVAGSEESSSLLVDLSITGSPKLREKAGLMMKMMEDSGVDCHAQGKLTTASS
ncbi:hypothetical protein Cni_G17961 [Canna indica]|uniref:ARM repeat superfamily protein n=1 Tax=Canna indica TaxID=4628 RepID=A0AAQ3QH92_9LILI|nr:hypothetical protein Cni_G17961 [Canna indica]